MKTKIRIKNVNNSYGVYATEYIRKETPVIKVNGQVVNKPTRHSIQIDTDKHVEPLSKDPKDETSAWGFLNHSCSPNAYFKKNELSFYALKDIQAGEEIRFNYNTTEYNMQDSFTCNCNSKNCYGEIKGFKYLPEEEKKSLLPYITFDLKEEEMK